MTHNTHVSAGGSNGTDNKEDLTLGVGIDTQSNVGNQTAEGNTITTAVNDRRSRKWVFTLNNYTDTDVTSLSEVFESKNWEYVFGEETGSNGTPHLQGYIEYKNPIAFKTLKKIIPRSHLEIAKGTRKDNWKYCTKENQVHTNIKIELTAEEEYIAHCEEVFNNVVWKDWQKNILDILDTKPNRRTINWIWEEEGGKGKTFVSQYIDWKYPTVIVNGKQSDVFNGIAKFIEQKNKQPRIVIVDIPRTNEQYCCYGTMEKIKDGLMYSGKYEGAQVRLTPLHLFVFANFPPKERGLSKDRLNIINIVE